MDNALYIAVPLMYESSCALSSWTDFICQTVVFI